MLPAICLDVGEAVFLSVWGEHGPTIVRWEEISRAIAVNVRVGSTMPLLRSATGQVFGAFLPDEVTAPFVRPELEAGLSEAFGVRTEADAAKFLPAANAVQKLLSEAEMGELFKVIAFSRGLDDTLQAFSSGDRSHTL